MAAECRGRLSTHRGICVACFTCVAQQQRVCFHYTVGILMSPAVRNTQRWGRESSRSARAVLGAHGTVGTGQRWFQLPGTRESSELTGEEKSWFDLETGQIGEETHWRQLHLEC